MYEAQLSEAKANDSNVVGLNNELAEARIIQELETENADLKNEVAKFNSEAKKLLARVKTFEWENRNLK